MIIFSIFSLFSHSLFSQTLVGSTTDEDVKFIRNNLHAGVISHNLYNTALGIHALRNNLSGSDNTALGSFSLMNNIGNSNTSIGQSSLSQNSTGYNNTALGTHAGWTLEEGHHNLILGAYNGYGIVNGNYNTIIGGEVDRYYYIPDVSNHIIISDGEGNKRIWIDNLGHAGLGTTSPTERLEVSSGYEGDSGFKLTNLTDSSTAEASNGKALSVNSQGKVILTEMSGGGTSSDAWLLSGNNATPTSKLGTLNDEDLRFVRGGQHAGIISRHPNSTGLVNTALGLGSLENNVNGYRNTSLGNRTLNKNISGGGNVAIGDESMWSNISGGGNTSVGAQSLLFNTSGSNNSAYGSGALEKNSTGGRNVAIGGGALISNVIGSNNTSIGSGAGVHSQGDNNIFVGFYSGTGIETGSNNTIVGNVVDYYDPLPDVSNHVIISDGAGNKRIWINQLGHTGLGTINPTERLEVSSGSEGNSGLKFTNLTQASTSAPSNGKALSVDTTGKVILTDISNLSSTNNTTNSQYYYGEWTNFNLQQGVNTFDITNCPITNWKQGVTAVTKNLLTNSVTMSVADSNSQVQVKAVSTTQFQVISNVATQATISLQYPGSVDVCPAPILLSVTQNTNGMIVSWDANGFNYNAITVETSNDGINWSRSTSSPVSPRITIFANFYRVVGECTGRSSLPSNIIEIEIP